MKRKLYGLLLLIFIMSVSFTVMANADTNEETTTASQETTIEETTAAETSAVSKVASLNYKKTIKVNKTFKLKTTLKLNTANINNYTFSTKNQKIATVSAKGVVKGIKKGSTTIVVTSKLDGSVYANIKVTVKNRYTKKSLRLMSALIYSEAGNQSYSGKKAVGIVVMNRISSKEFPNTLSKVIYERGQFTPTRNGMLKKSLKKYDKGKLPKSCIKAAKEALNGSKTVKMNNRTINMKGYLFFSKYIKYPRLEIGDHQFR